MIPFIIFLSCECRGNEIRNGNPSAGPIAASGADLTAQSAAPPFRPIKINRRHKIIRNIKPLIIIRPLLRLTD